MGVLGPTCCMSFGEGVSCVISLVSLSVILHWLKSLGLFFLFCSFPVLRLECRRLQWDPEATGVLRLRGLARKA